MSKRDEFEYVNHYYRLSITKHCRVLQKASASWPSGRSGQVAKGDGQYIWIRWDGAPKAQGPYHPTDGLSYPPPAQLQSPERP